MTYFTLSHAKGVSVTLDRIDSEELLATYLNKLNVHFFMSKKRGRLWVRRYDIEGRAMGRLKVTFPLKERAEVLLANAAFVPAQSKWQTLLDRLRRLIPLNRKEITVMADTDTPVQDVMDEEDVPHTNQSSDLNKGADDLPESEDNRDRPGFYRRQQERSKEEEGTATEIETTEAQAPLSAQPTDESIPKNTDEEEPVSYTLPPSQEKQDKPQELEKVKETTVRRSKPPLQVEKKQPITPTRNKVIKRPSHSQQMPQVHTATAQGQVDTFYHRFEEEQLAEIANIEKHINEAKEQMTQLQNYITSQTSRIQEKKAALYDVQVAFQSLVEQMERLS